MKLQTKKRFYTPGELAEMMAVHKATIYRMVERGELPAIRFGRSIRFDADEIEAFLRNVTTQNELKEQRFSLQGIFKGGKPVSEQDLEEAKRIWKSRELP